MRNTYFAESLLIAYRVNEKSHIIEVTKLLVPYFYEQRKITKENYDKWLLYETGEYVPPLIKDN